MKIKQILEKIKQKGFYEAGSLQELAIQLGTYRTLIGNIVMSINRANEFYKKQNKYTGFFFHSSGRGKNKRLVICDKNSQKFYEILNIIE